MKINYYKRYIFITFYSLATAIILLLVSYIATNIGVSFSGETDIIGKSNYYLKRVISKNNPIPDSLLFVNISYDKQLTDIYDEDGFKLGCIDITNRQSLLHFLDILSHRNDYKFVTLDVRFEKGIETEYDSMLYARIASMERIAIPATHNSQTTYENSLKNKTRLSDYITTFFSNNYHKFEIERDGMESIPYFMYKSITNNKHSSYGIFHFDNGELCNRTLFTYPHIISDGLYAQDGSRNYYNLGSDLLIDEEALLNDNLLANKYIFIGDMVLNDNHETTMGNMPGCTIIANAFISFMHRQHVIPFTVIMILFIIYFVFAYQIYSRKSIYAIIVEWRNKKNKKNFPIIGIILSWFTYSFTLSAICLIFYYTCGIAYDILITATLIQLIDYIVAHSSHTTNLEQA